MRLVISNASVLFDLKLGQLLEPVLSSSIEIAVPDLLYERELKDYNGCEMIDLGLRVEELDGKGVAQATHYRQTAALCLVESFAVAIAKISCFALFASDRKLHQLAKSEGLVCYDIIWVLNRLMTEKIVSFEKIHKGLKLILQSPCCCLSQEALNQWLHNFLNS